MSSGDKNNSGYEVSRKTVDLERVIENKSPRLRKLLPGFIIRYLKSIIHEDKINDFLYRNRNKYGLDFCEAILTEFGIELVVINEHLIPREGRYVVAANHPLGGIDGIALMHVIGRVRKDIVFPVNDLLMNLPNLKELFIPINKHGSNVQNIEAINETFAGDKLILYFPAGLVSRKRSGVVKDLPWKKTFLTKARRYERDILPVYMKGRNTNFFYNLANIRKFLGIKANIEMLYLVNETYKQRNKKLYIVFGEPVPISSMGPERKDQQWTEHIREKVYSLEKLIMNNG